MALEVVMMSQRLPVPALPVPLEGYVALFDDLFGRWAQRRCLREYLQGLLLPRDRNKTLTSLAGAEPIVQAQEGAVQRLQFFLSESNWDSDAVAQRRLEILFSRASLTPHEHGVLVIDETGDKKDGTKTDHVARQYLGSLGKVDNGIVAVSSLWADERVYYPLHVEPYTPACRLEKGTKDPSFRTKPQIALELIDRAIDAGVSFRAIVADCLYGDNAGLEGALFTAGLPFVMATKPLKGVWAPVDQPHSVSEALKELGWQSAAEPGEWLPVVRRFRDGHEQTWWAVEVTFAGYGPERSVRLVVASSDPATLRTETTWYLITNLPAPGSAASNDSPVPAADLEEVVRLYALRNWVEQSYKQTKQQLGWADFQVRSDRAIRRHWEMVNCAFCFCWWHSAITPPSITHSPVTPQAELLPAAETPATQTSIADGSWGEKEPSRACSPTRDRSATAAAQRPEGERRQEFGDGVVASGVETDPGMAGAIRVPVAILESLERCPTAGRAPAPSRQPRSWSADLLLHPLLTNYR